DEVDELGDALAADDLHGLVRAVIGEVVVPRRDARVDNRHADAGAVETELLLDGAGAERDGRTIHLAAKLAVVVNRGGTGIICQAFQYGGGQLDDLAADETEAPSAAAAEAIDVAVDRAARLQHDDGARAAQTAARTIIELSIELGMIAGLASRVAGRVLPGVRRAAPATVRGPICRNRQAENA